MRRGGFGGGLGLFDLCVGLLLLAGFLNFTYTAVQGQYGVFAIIATEAEAERLEADREAMRAERRLLEARIAAFSGDAVDLDLLDETARDVLGLARPEELLPPPL